MAVTTVNEWTYQYNGLSTDEKPIIGVGNGSRFREMDTNKLYAFDGASQTWLYLPGGQQGSEFVGGDGIKIIGGEISVDTDVIATKDYADSAAQSAADGAKPTAGTGILVNGTQVSVDQSVIATRQYAQEQAQAAKPAAGSGILVSGTTVSVDTDVMATRDYVDSSVGVQFTVTDVIIEDD